MEERRNHPRRTVKLQVTYESRAKLVEDLITDLSPGGVFLRTDNPLPIGTELDLTVQLADRTPCITVLGEVVRVVTDGMGVRFTGKLGPVLSELIAERAGK